MESFKKLVPQVGCSSFYLEDDFCTGYQNIGHHTLGVQGWCSGENTGLAPM